MKQLLLFFCVCVSVGVNAQVSGKVIDSLGAPVPYANIWVDGEVIGATSNELGAFTINAAADNIVVFSALGFEAKNVEANNAATVVLKSIPFELDNVTVSNRTGKHKIEAGNYRKGQAKIFHASSGQPIIMAKYFPVTADTKEHPFLKEVTVYTHSLIKSAKIQLRFFGADKDGKPGEDLNDKKIIIEVKSGSNNNTVNLEDYNIVFPESGMFIALEWMLIKENEYTFVQDSQSVTTHMPVIGVTPTEVGTSWQYYGGHWVQEGKTQQSLRKEYDNKYAELAIKLTLTD